MKLIPFSYDHSCDKCGHLSFDAKYESITTAHIYKPNTKSEWLELTCLRCGYVCKMEVLVKDDDTADD